MLVFMTADTVGGVWTYALQLARALARRGANVLLATMGPPPDAAQRRAARAVPRLELFPSQFRLEWRDDPWLDVALAGEWLLDLARQARPDVVYLNGFAHGALAWPAPVVVAGHSCVLSWWEACRGGAAPHTWNRYRREVARGIRAAGAVIAPTRAMLRALERHYGPLPRARVVPNGRDAALFRADGPKKPFVLAAGRVWDEAKNVAAIDRVAPRLPWDVLAAGRGARAGRDRRAGRERARARAPRAGGTRGMARARVDLRARGRPHDHRVLRVEPGVDVLERRRDLLPRDRARAPRARA